MNLSKLILAATLLEAFASAQQIAFTFDDLPSHSTLPPGGTRQQVAANILATLKQAKLPPTYGFVNAIRIEEQPDTLHVLEAWCRDGNPLGNHSWSHINLDQHTVAEFEADVLHDEPVLSQQARSSDWHWFRFPYLAEGQDSAKRAEVRAFLNAHAYKVAAVTMSFGDYAWNEPLARCSAKANAVAIADLESSYLASARAAAADSRAKAKLLLGHDIPYVLLMHLGAFDARMLPRLLALYRDLRFTFVTLSPSPSRTPSTSPISTSRQPLPNPRSSPRTAQHESARLPQLPANSKQFCR